MKPEQAKKIIIGNQVAFADSSYKAQFLREVKYEILKIGKIVAKGDVFQHKVGRFRIYDTEPNGEVEVTYDTEFAHIYCCAFCDHVLENGEDYYKHLQSEGCRKARNKKGK